MSKEMSTFFFLRPGFERFQLDPETNQNILIGDRDRRHRDIVLDGIEEAVYSMEGHKAVIYGDFGRGKTHEAHNIIALIAQRKLKVKAVYVRSHEFTSKEPFSTLFGMLIEGLRADFVYQLAVDYKRLVIEGKANPIAQVVGSDEIAEAFGVLENPNISTVRKALRWLGGGKDVKPSSFATDISGYLTVSRDFAAVMKGFAHMLRTARDQVLVFFIDECERLGQITHNDTYWSWVGCLRAVTELSGVGMIFYVGAKTRDGLPNMLTWDEVVTRIGGQNYRELLEPSREELKQWITELFQTLVRKGDVPQVHRDMLPEVAQDTSVPQELQELVEADPDVMEAYPFTPDALDELVTQCVTEDMANRPREVLKRIQAAARRAMRLDSRVVNATILRAVQGDGF